MELAEAMKLLRKERALESQLKRLADGAPATMRLTIESRYGDQIWFYRYRGRRAFTVPESECFDKTDEEIAALVEKHLPGYLAKLDEARAERKRRQRIRVKRSNELISWKREQARKRITTCNAPGCKEPITAIRASKMFCSAACRQRARRRWAN